MSKPTDLKADKKGKTNVFLKTDDRLDDAMKKAKDKKISVNNRKINDKSNTSSNSDLKDVDSRPGMQSKKALK